MGCQHKSNLLFPNLLEFGEHLLKLLKISSQISKKNPTFNIKFNFLKEHLWSPEQWLGTIQCLGILFLDIQI